MLCYSAPNVTSVRLLGEIQVLDGSQRHSPAIGKPMSLLAFLACDGGWVERDRLAFLFWPDAVNGRSRANLRALLARCRKLPFAHALVADADRVRWAVDSDVRAFRRALREEAWEEAVALYRGDLLGGRGVEVGPEYAAWLELERESLKEGFRNAAARRVDSLEEAGRTREALRVLDSLLALDALDEDALRQSMRLLAAEARPADALRRYRSFVKRLEGELGLAPTSATAALAREIETDSGGIRTRSAEAGTPVADASSASTTGCAVALPVPVEPFVGRSVELAELTRRLGDAGCRLLTVTGVAGAGKTRLALRGALDQRGRFSGGCWFVPLESVEEAASLAMAIAAALGVKLAGEEDPLGAVVRRIGESHALLVLDNFDHVLGESALLLELLERCPRVQLLVTSRERLALPVEWLLPLEGLSCPADGVSVREARAFDAVRFFAERAARVRPDFRLDEETLPDVLTVCRTVDGLPLALELAAAWMRAMPVGEIASELEDGIELLKSRDRGVPERHRSIATALERSWRLLAPPERDALARLAVFRAGFRREAAAFVAGATLPLLAALVDKSLVRASPDGRFDLHPLVRRFSLGKLAGGPRAARTRERHARFYLSLFEDGAREAERGTATRAAERLLNEYPDALGALDWALLSERPSLALQLAGALIWFWVSRGIVSAARERFEQVLAMPSLERNDTLVRVLDAAARKAAVQGDDATATSLCERCLALAGELGNAVMVCESENMLATCMYTRGEYRAARDLLEANLRRARGLRHRKGAQFALGDLGEVALRQGDVDAAAAYFGEAAAGARASRDAPVAGRFVAALGLVALAQGEPRRARALAEQGVSEARVSGTWFGLAYAERCLARVALEQGDLEAARAALAPGLASLWEAGYFLFVAESIELAALLTAAQGEPATATRLWAAAEAFRQARAIALPPADAARRQRALDGARAAIGNGAFMQAWEAGRALDLGDAVELAASALEGTAPHVLGRREAHVGDGAVG